MDGLSTSANGGGGLQDSKTSKIALNMGEPKEMEYIGAGKEKRMCLAAQPCPQHPETARVPAAPMLPTPS